MDTMQNALGGPIMLVVFILIMYFLLILPQKRREKEMRKMLDAIEVGNEVVTIGGISGKVLNVKEDEIVIETSVEKTQLAIKKWALKESKKKAE